MIRPQNKSLMPTRNMVCLVFNALGRAAYFRHSRSAARDTYAELSERNALTSMYFICDENAPRAETRAAYLSFEHRHSACTESLRLFSELVPTLNSAL